MEAEDLRSNAVPGKYIECCCQLGFEAEEVSLSKFMVILPSWCIVWRCIRGNSDENVRMHEMRGRWSCSLDLWMSWFNCIDQVMC